jgi:uncharacterized membrane protein YkoI
MKESFILTSCQLHVDLICYFQQRGNKFSKQKFLCYKEYIKMKINKTIATAVLLFGLLMGGLAAGVLYSQKPLDANAAPPAQQGTTCVDDDDVQHEAENEADDDTEADACPEEDEANEADTDNVQEEHENQADDATEANEAEETNGADEADEAATLQGQTGITADEAQAAVEAANPGIKTLAVELDNENGTVIYEVELDNGQDVKVDATNGNILGADQRDAD